MDESEVYGAIEDMGYEEEDEPPSTYLRLPIPPGSMAIRLLKTPTGYSTSLAINTLGYNNAVVSDEEYILAGVAWLINMKSEKLRKLGKKRYKAVFGDDPYRPPFWSKNTDLRHSLCVGSA